LRKQAAARSSAYSACHRLARGSDIVNRTVLAEQEYLVIGNWKPSRALPELLAARWITNGSRHGCLGELADL